MIKEPPYVPNFPTYSTYNELLNVCESKISEIVDYSDWNDISDLLALLILCGKTQDEGSSLRGIKIISTDVDLKEIEAYRMEELQNLEERIGSNIKNKYVQKKNKNKIKQKIKNKYKQKGESYYPSVGDGGETNQIHEDIDSMNHQKKRNKLKTHFKGKFLGFADSLSPLNKYLFQGKGTRIVDDTYYTRVTLVGSNLQDKSVQVPPLVKNNSALIDRNGYFVLHKDFSEEKKILSTLRKSTPIVFKIKFNSIVLTTKVHYYDELGNVFPIAQLVDQYPEYASLPDLRSYGKGDFPKEYVNTELKNVKDLEIVAEGDIESFEDIQYYVTPSLNRIRHYRIPELYYLYQDSTFLQGLSMYDGRFNELEILGTWIYFSFVDVPSRIKDYFSQQLDHSNNGMTLRARLKVLTTSMKRWLPYWEEYLKTDNIYSYLEIETILGYIVSNEYSDVHVDNLNTTLSPTPINYINGRDFLKDYLNVLLTSWKVEEISIRDISLIEYFNSWNLWTTSGAASEVIIIGLDGKKYRINKSALPLVTTPKELFESRFQPYKSLLKSEVGKVRIAYSAPTYDSLVEGYILYKYEKLLVDCDHHDYVSFKNTVKLDFSIGVSKILEQSYFGSTDIEKNDFSHDTYLDMYAWSKLLENKIQPDDIPIFLDLASRKSLNWVFVRKEISGPNVDYTNDEGSYLLGRGGIMSGRRSTTFINNVQNSTFNNLSGMLLSEYNILQYKNYYGGDDSLCRATSYYMYWARMTINSKIMLVINPIKSYVSDYNAEFFRVASKKGTRQGYVTRTVHSIVASNPVSKQEIDKKNRIKAMYSNIQMFVRRGGDERTFDLIKIYSKVAKVPIKLLSIPVSEGGVGVNEIVEERCKPGIPQFKDDNNQEDYKLNTTWFNSLDFREDIPAVALEQVEESYKQDMLNGIKDITRRNERKEDYKHYYNKFITNMRIINISKNLKRYLKKIKRFDNFLDKETGELKFSEDRIKKSALDLLTNELQNNPLAYAINYTAASDVINRFRTTKVKEKINVLLSNRLVYISNSYINSRSGKLLLNEIVSSVSTNGIHKTLSPDSTTYRKVNSYNMIGMEYLDYSTCVYLQYVWKLRLVGFTSALIGNYQKW